MKKNLTVSIHLIENAYKQKFSYLFNCAYLITGSERTAESILMNVILQYPMPEEGEFDEIFSLIKQQSIKSASKEDGALFAFSGDVTGVKMALSEWILTIDEKKARTLVLRYALGLGAKEISHLTGDRIEKVKAILERGKIRASNGEKGARNAVSLLKGACREVLLTSCFPPDFSAILRSIERVIEDKNNRQERSFSVKPVISWLFTGILMVLITVIVWMSVVLIDYFREPMQAANPVFPAYTQSPENTEG